MAVANRAMDAGDGFCDDGGGDGDGGDGGGGDVSDGGGDVDDGGDGDGVGGGIGDNSRDDQHAWAGQKHESPFFTCTLLSFDGFEKTRPTRVGHQ